MKTVLCVGHAVLDFVFGVGHLPQRAEKHFAHSLTLVGGGPAATAAVTVARLGGRAILAARIGGDAIGAMIAAELESYGVDCRHLRRCDGVASSISAVMVDPGGERMIINHMDRALPASAHWLPDPAMLGADVVLADTRWAEGAAAAMVAARRAGLPGVLDADRPVPADGVAVGQASHVAFSSPGLADFSGERDPVRGLLAVAERAPGWNCVTAGATGIYVHAGGKVAAHPGFAVPVVDTLGAGDVWHGAFALALAEGHDELRALRFASAAAALKVQRAGGRKGVPTRPEVEAFLAANPETAVAT